MDIVDKKNTDEFRSLIEKSNSIVLIAHINPDGDAVASLLGMCNALSKIGKQVTPVLPTMMPEYFSFLPKSQDIIFGTCDMEKLTKTINETDLLVFLDLNNIKRVGDLQHLVRNSKAPKVLIDHHEQPEIEAFDVIFSRPEMSSASELVYWVITSTFGKEIMDSNIAMCLYTGICTDTGSFSYSCNEKSVYTAVGELLEYGIDIKNIHDQIFNTYSKNRLLFLGYCISNCLHILNDIHAAYFYVSKAEQDRYQIKDSDMEGIVNYALMMKEIEVGVMLKESSTGVRLSLRSKHDFDVNIFANKYFNGGGHQKAAGAGSPYSFEETRQRLEQYLYDELKPKN